MKLLGTSFGPGALGNSDGDSKGPSTKTFQNLTFGKYSSHESFLKQTNKQRNPA